MKNKLSPHALTGMAFLILCLATACSPKLNFQAKHVVFISAEEEYRSEESLPMLARILKRETGAKVSFCFSVDSLGFINPNNAQSIQGLEQLQQADLVVIFARFRAIPPEQLKYITDYVESGRPIVGLRTSTHTFLYKDDPTRQHLNNDWPAKVFGQQWITHHGHFDDGKNPLTDVTLNASQATHPILRGVAPFQAYSWLYHVDGGAWRLQGDCTPLLTGHSLKSQHALDGKLDQFPLTNPVAWTKTYTGASGKTARVFFTTLGHPYDFRDPSMRKLVLNGMVWALGAEQLLPRRGMSAKTGKKYAPGNSGFGERYRKGVRAGEVME